MTNPLRTAEDYELFLYSIGEQFSSVKRSTIVFSRHGATLARMAGELFFERNIRLVVRKRIVFHRLPAVIDWYGYEVWRETEKLYWYDSQAHPDEPALQSTHPHHKHIPPNIKHQRVPASTMSFSQPNLSALISEIESLIKEDT